MAYQELPQLEIPVLVGYLLTGDDLLQRIWQVESCDHQSPSYSLDEQVVMDHFHTSCHCDQAGRCMVPLPKKENVVPLGESRSLTIRRFLRLECSLQASRKFHEFADIIK